MRRILLTALCCAALAGAAAGAGRAQKKQEKCEQAAQTERNWEQMADGTYVYFDYVLCPPEAKPANPLVRVWLTSEGDGIAVEKWKEARDGADLVSMFHGKKKAYTLYRDLDAVPVSVFKAERRGGVPADMAAKPFLAEGSSLVPFENLTPESAARAAKVFENADVLVRQAARKVALIREVPHVEAIVQSLGQPLKARD